MFGLSQQDEDDGDPAGPPPRRRLARRPYVHGRNKTLSFRVTAEEYQRLYRAAELTQLTPTGFMADATMKAAEATIRAEEGDWEVQSSDLVIMGQANLRAAVVKLMAASLAVNQVGHNLNQAVKKLNTTGVAPASLQETLKAAREVVAEVDRQSYEVSKIIGIRR